MSATMPASPVVSSARRLAHRLMVWPLVLLGRYPRRKSSMRYLARYLDDRATFVAAGGRIAQRFPILTDYADQAGTARGHYFHQDLLVATLIEQARPERHIDVGSRVDGFVAHVAAFRPIEVIDIRPLQVAGHERIRFLQGDLMALDPSLRAVCDSLSCLHVIEHFGLGRYGDRIDPQGHRVGFRNLIAVLKPGGTLYISFPIGESGVHFNAHRVFAPSEVLTWEADALELMRFDYVDDAGDLQLRQDPARVPALRYGCGIYSFRKRA
jgi:SAM-dependent methyltransferase